MEFTLFKNIIDYFKNAVCVRTFIYTTLGFIVFGAVFFLISYFFKQKKKLISVMLFFVLIALIFLINFIFDMGKSRIEAPKVVSPPVIQKPKQVVEEKVLVSEPAHSEEAENFALY